MDHQRYVAQRSQREPRFASEREAAAAELAVGEAIFGRREELGRSLVELAAMTGIAEERLRALEEGEAMTLHEVLWLAHALDLSVSLGPGFHVVSKALDRAAVR